MPRSETISVLLIDSSGAESDRLSPMLRSRPGTGGSADGFTLQTAADMDSACGVAESEEVDVLLAVVPHSTPTDLEGLEQLHARLPALPIVVLTDEEDEQFVFRAASLGAQDCLVRSELTGSMLARALRYAVERQQLQTELHKRSVVDELTGLYNRRGFFALGEQELRRGRRRGEGFLLVYADVDGLKKVNDRHGHEAGDALIVAAAEFLRGFFRSSDILGRLGGDEFAVIAHHGRDAVPVPETIRTRIEARLAVFNNDRDAAHPLSLSVGVLSYEPGSPAAKADTPEAARAAPAGGSAAAEETPASSTLDELLSRADGEMYRHKKARRG